MTSSPCKDCPVRFRACWDNCKKYKEFKDKLEEEKKIINCDKDYYNYRSDKSVRINKILNKK